MGIVSPMLELPLQDELAPHAERGCFMSPNTKGREMISQSWLDQKAISSFSSSERIPTFLWTTDTGFRLASLVGEGFGPADGQPENYRGASLDWLFPNLGPDSSLVLAHERALQGESSTIRAEINGRDLHARVDPLRAPNGEIVGVIGTVHDDTERHVSERALKLSEEGYRGLIERAPFAICQSTVSGQLLQVNHTMVEMLGYESETDLLVRSLKSDISVTPSSYDDLLAELGTKALLQGFECQWHHQDGHPIDVCIAGRAVLDLSGVISHLELLAEDVTERKHLEA